MIATVLIPTFKDRGRSLRYTVDSILRQTVQDLEIFIMGDGVAGATREIIGELCRADERVKFYDHPKHPRRGEPHRHAALMADARGEIVTYCTDHDLYLEDHVEKFHQALQTSDFTHSLPCTILDDGTLDFPFVASQAVSLQLYDDPAQYQPKGSLPQFGHRLDFYKDHAETCGWRETPAEFPTDRWFNYRMNCTPGVRVSTIYDYTVVYLGRYASTKRNDDAYFAEETRQWHERLIQPGFTEWFRRECACRYIDAETRRNKSDRDKLRRERQAVAELRGEVEKLREQRDALKQKVVALKERLERRK